MTQRLVGIGTAMVAVALTAGVVVAQRADDAQGQVGPRGQAVQQVPPPQQPPPAGQVQQQGPGQPGAPAQVGPGRGFGPGFGRGQGFGPGYGQGNGQGFGPGFGRGQGMGPERGMGGPGRGMGPAGRGRGGLDAMGPGAGRGAMFAQLDLTEDQRRAIETIERATRDQAAAVTDELELARKTLHREVFADKRDAAKITALGTKVTTLEKQLFDLHLKTQAGIADLLTPAQRETMRIGR
jgi:Spy/CpxP family protein refolding chaperone